MYGTYARGWGGEGEYGEGDKVYVTDAKGRHQKKNCFFFFRKTPKGGEGGLAESKISLTEKN